MRRILPVLICAATFASCSNSKEDKLIGTWQAIKLENPALEKDLNDQQHFIDTIGKSTTPEMNLKMYGSKDVEPVKNSLRAQLDEAKMMQQYTVDHTVFEFRKDKVAVLTFGSQPDSANWYLDDEGSLILDDMKLKGTGDKTKMEIVSVTDTLLQLRYTEDGVTSTATFHPMKK